MPVFRCLFKDNRGLIWIGTRYEGIIIIDPASGELVRYKNDPYDDLSLSSDEIRVIFEDDINNMWIGTHGGGINKHKTNYRFKTFRDYSGNRLSFNIRPVYSVFSDNDNTVWLGTIGNGLVKIIDGDYKNYKTYTPLDPLSINNNTILSICSDNHGKLWVGTAGAGLQIFDKDKETFNYYYLKNGDKLTLGNLFVFSIFKDRTGLLWIATANGLNKFNPNTDELTEYLNIPGDSNSISSNNIFMVHEDKNDNLMIATDTGLNVYNRETDTFSNFRHNPIDKTTLSNDFIYNIFEDSSGAVWLGTNGGGLNKFDAEHGTFIHYTESDGLANNSVSGILEDSFGRLWISTSNGLSMFDQRTEAFTNFSLADGLSGEEFNERACLKMENGEMMFGGMRGLTVFDPDVIENNISMPPVYITDIKNPENGISFRSEIIENKEIVLPYKMNNFSAEFVALDFNYPPKNKYQYILEGYDEDWIFSGSQRIIDYKQLRSGVYRFRVRATNSAGVWNPKEASINITIETPYWKSTWFKVLAGFSLISLLIALYVLMLYRQKIINRKLQSLVDIRTEKLNESYEKYHSLFESIGDTIFVHDIEGRILSVNHQAMNEYGYSLEEFFSMTISQVDSPEESKFAPERIAKLVAQGNLKFETHHQRKDGSIFQTEVISRRIDWDGEPAMLSICRDITERKEAEKELNQTKLLLKSCLESPKDLIILALDTNYRYLYFNNAHKTDMKHAYNIDIENGMSIMSFITSEEDRQNIKINYDRTLSGESHTTIQEYGNIERTYYESLFNPIVNDKKDIVGITVFARDITERKKADEQIKASLKEKEVLIREIHHRVKNNLQVMSSLLKLQAEQIKDKELSHLFNESINRIHTMSLIHNMLYQSKNLSQIDFKQYIPKLCENLKILYKSKSRGIDIIYNIIDIDMKIDNAIPCGLIINELISNSLKHAFPDGRKGEINVSMHKPKENSINLVISDNGTGFAENVNWRKTDSLGLELVAILGEDQLQGKIDFKTSENGTEFKISFEG